MFRSLLPRASRVLRNVVSSSDAAQLALVTRRYASREARPSRRHSGEGVNSTLSSTPTKVSERSIIANAVRKRAGHHDGDSYGVKWGIEASPGVTSLNDDPYGWDLTQRWPKEAPLWMIYEAERDEIALPKPVERKERNRSKGRGLLRLPMRDETGRSMATGRRKTAVAQVVVRLGSGIISVNDKPIAEYFPRMLDRHHALEPLLATQTVGAFDFNIHVRGGGHSGQSGAIRHGIACALAKFDPFLKPSLQQGGFLLRDPRAVERKKPGQLKARRKFQWVKR